MSTLDGLIALGGQMGWPPVGIHLHEGQGISEEGCWEEPGRARTTVLDTVGEAAFQTCPRP